MRKAFDLTISTILYILLLSIFIYSQDMKEDVENLLKEEFGNNVKIYFSKYEVNKNISTKIEKRVKQKFFASSVYLYRVSSNEKSVGYAILDNVYGKSLPITFIVLFDPDGNIISSHIVKYREQYGGSVKNPKWNEQFIGKSSNSSFEIGKDINSISGATISVNSVTKGIQKSALLIKEIIENGE